MANNFLKYKKINIGKSIFEKNSENIVKKLLNLSKKSNCNLYFPEDVNTGKHFDRHIACSLVSSFNIL